MSISIIYFYYNIIFYLLPFSNYHYSETLNINHSPLATGTVPIVFPAKVRGHTLESGNVPIIIRCASGTDQRGHSSAGGVSPYLIPVPMAPLISIFRYSTIQV